MGSSRVGAVFERREREQKRSGGEGGGPANILVRGIKCSVAFVHRFRFENHWQLLQHLERRSQAEQSKTAGIGLPLPCQARYSTVCCRDSRRCYARDASNLKRYVLLRHPGPALTDALR